MTSTKRLVRHFGCVVAVGWCASGCLDPLIEDPSATGAADVSPAPAEGPGYADEATDGPADSDAGTTSGAATDGSAAAAFGVLDTRDASTSNVEAGADAGQASSNSDAGVVAGETDSTSEQSADSDASASTSVP